MSRPTPGEAMALVPTIRPLTIGDVPSVWAIETAASPDPWSEDLFAGELADDRHDRHWLVAEAPAPDRSIVGFGGVLFAADEVHVMNLAVAPAMQRRGIAARLLVELLSTSVDRGAVAATLEVRPSNDPAIALYERFGFEAVGRRPRYYPDGEDAVIMWAHRLHRLVGTAP